MTQSLQQKGEGEEGLASAASSTGLSPTVEPVPVSPPDGASIPDAWRTLKSAIASDPGYAWGWQCNLAMPIMDAIDCTHEQANLAAAHLMAFLFDHDITQHPFYQYEKSGAQEHHELMTWLDACRDSDTHRMAETGTGSVRSMGSAGPTAIAQPPSEGDHP